MTFNAQRAWLESVRPSTNMIEAASYVLQDGYSMTRVLRLVDEFSDGTIDAWVRELEGVDYDVALGNSILHRDSEINLSANSYSVAQSLVNTVYAQARLADWLLDRYRPENQDAVLLLRLMRVPEELLAVWDKFDMFDAARLFFDGVPVEAVEGSLRGDIDSGLVLRAYGVESA